MNNIKVSVICLVYNHEKYIRQTLEGFVNQETNFDFEVLINDDASTDRSAEIIREFESKYPSIIKPIYQVENQYSQGVRIFYDILFPKVQGKYLAFCEGDDYWIDAKKLQKQYDVLESNPQIGICTHSAFVTENEKIVFLSQPSRKDCVFTPEEVLKGGGPFVATASLMLRRNNCLFDKFGKIVGGDYSLQIIGSIPNGMIFLNDFMSVYRHRTPGSWTARNERIPEKIWANAKKIHTMLETLNLETDYKYDNTIKEIIRNSIFYHYFSLGDYRRIRDECYEEYQKTSTFKKFYILLLGILPTLANIFLNSYRLASRLRMTLRSYRIRWQFRKTDLSRQLLRSKCKINGKDTACVDNPVKISNVAQDLL